MMRQGYDLPETLGHEVAGVTDDGTQVAIEPMVPCGSCDGCDRGAYHLCRSGPSMIYGVGRPGGMAEEMIVAERCLVPLPAGVDATEACLVEPLAVAVHGLRNIELRGDQRVAIIGGGSIGLCAVAAARASGAHVSLSARHDAQERAGAALGAEAVDGEYDLVVDAAGTKSALEQAVQWVRPGGTLLLLGTYWDGLELPGTLLCMKEVRVVPSMTYSQRSGSRDVEAAAALMAQAPEIAANLISHRFPLEAAAEAFDAAGNRERGAIKVVLEP